MLDVIEDSTSIPALEAAAVPIATAPFGQIAGGLFTVHLVGDETTAVWLTTVALSSLTVLLLAKSRS